jgi:hypothetical protein
MHAAQNHPTTWRKNMSTRKRWSHFAGVDGPHIHNASWEKLAEMSLTTRKTREKSFGAGIDSVARENNATKKVVEQFCRAS